MWYNYHGYVSFKVVILSCKLSRINAFGIKERVNFYWRRTGMINYGFTKEFEIPYETVIRLVREALKKEGFGILTEINVKEKMKEKIGLDMRKYIILGACNPPNAFKAILAEENIGLMLPCNVIVYEKGSKTVLSVIRPTVAMQMIDNVELQKLADAVEGQLKKAFDAVK
jgi:uncharacterized protein (DUF302 family)